MGLYGVGSIINKFTGNAIISSDTLGDVMADVKMSESHKYETMVTTHTLEKGTQVSDHVISEPVECTLNFQMTNLGYAPTINKALNAAGFNSVFDSRAQEVFDRLADMIDRRELITISTEHRIYENMIIKSFNPLHSAPYKGSLQISVSVQQITFAEVERIKLETTGSKQGNVNKSLASTAKAGTAKAEKVEEVNSSTLLDMKNKLKKALNRS